MNIVVNLLCLLFPIFCFDLQFAYGRSHVALISASAYFLLLSGFIFASSTYRLKNTDLSVSENITISLAALLTSLITIPLCIFNYARFDLPAVNDIGSSTISAATMLFKQLQNPYSSQTLSILGSDPGFYGYKYGPVAIFGYALSAFFPQQGMKYSSLFFVFISAILIALIVSDKKCSIATNTSRILVGLAILLASQVFWYELFTQGVVDIWQVMLLLASFLYYKNQKIFFAGLFLGFSLSSKFAPGIFFVFALGKLLFNKNLLLGLTIGLSPMIPFLIWDFNGFINNYILFHIIKPPNFTSLLSLMDASYWWLFSAFQIVVIFITFKNSFFKNINIFKLILNSSVLACCIEISYKEIHQNHLIWIIPLAAIIYCKPKVEVNS